jgi:Fic family protein
MPYVEPAPTLASVLGSPSDPSFLELISRAQGDPAAATPGGKYRHWHTLRHLTPPEGLSHVQWWATVKIARSILRRPLPLTDPAGEPFVYCNVDQVQELAHHVDQQASGAITMPELVTADAAAKQRFIVNSLIEESIRSSQLEGATTSRVVAKEMIRSGREPTDRSEQMILNNYRAMQFMREEASGDLTPDLVLTLHRILTEATLDDPNDAGRLQQAGEPRVGVFEGERQVHQPPPAEKLPERLEQMCAFANALENPSGFLHPVVRSILLHFWLAYDHPFVDGNGRTARALFYWSMRRRGYWLTEYLSISRIFREASTQYYEAFLLSETDERDTTYFVLFHLQTISRAIDEAHEYLQRKMKEVREVEHTIRGSERFNHRQLALLGNAMRNPDAIYTFHSHLTSHGVTHQTARTDLLGLVDEGLLELRKRGRRYVFVPVEDLSERLRHPQGA